MRRAPLLLSELNSVATRIAQTEEDSVCSFWDRQEARAAREEAERSVGYVFGMTADESGAIGEREGLEDLADPMCEACPACRAFPVD